ncbi:MAG: alpha/beta hydrolase [Gemmatimonadota bacterium]|nr:alpha/beta hydrolase [Gemmatimonadota bacterium]MDE2865847.1 alpha/beta hydrolase [Gemmatimonadota bacterium]
MATLHHEIVEAPGSSPRRRMLLLHGIYGAGRNWGTVARRLVRARPEWSVVLADLRSHGHSPRLAPHTLECCAADLLDVEDHLGGPADAVLGHSFGGKVALLHARERARPAGSGAPRQLWIVDSSPSIGAPGGSAWRMLGVLRRHPGPFGSRAEAVDAVESEGFAPLVANWMAINAVRTDAGLEWRLDPDEMEAYLRDYFRTDAWDLAESPPAGTDVHFIRALGSSVLDEAAVARIRRAARGTGRSVWDTGRVFLHEVDGGHWVNTENPDALHELLVAGLR